MTALAAQEPSRAKKKRSRPAPRGFPSVFAAYLALAPVIGADAARAAIVAELGKVESRS